MLYPLLPYNYRIESNVESTPDNRPTIVIYPPDAKPVVFIEIRGNVRVRFSVAQHLDIVMSIVASNGIQKIKEMDYTSDLPPDTRTAIICGIGCLEDKCLKHISKRN